MGRQMSDQVHVLVVRAAGASRALPMDGVEQTFSLRVRRIPRGRHAGGRRRRQGAAAVPDGVGDQLCELFGTSLKDEMGRSALLVVGNILASSYLNAIVEMSGMAPEPERRRSRSTCWATRCRRAWKGSPSPPIQPC
jgi:hypothetical protein